MEWHTFNINRPKQADGGMSVKSTGGSVFQAVCDVMGSVEVSPMWITVTDAQ